MRQKWQVDWLFDILGDLKDNESVLSIVTSADIDSLIIHLFCLALHWPRNETGGFKHKVYVLLQKQKRELYDITRIIEILESRFGRTAASNIPIVLCLGGNDFLPKFHGLSHEKWVTETTQIPNGLENIVQYTIDKKTVKPVIGTVNEEIYFEIVKRLYCPSSIDADAVSLDAVRQMSIKLPSKQVRHPTSWMPPRSALLKVIQLVNWQLAYLLSVSKANANLPDFSTYQCFRTGSKGIVQYNFGEDVKVENVQALFTLSEDDMKSLMSTASKARKKRPPSTATRPNKPRQRKRRPVMSTPM